MNTEMDESEFYHQDFTTASDWEIFIARIEEIINQWKVDDLKDKEFQLDIWKIVSEKISFADTEFELFYYKLNTIEEHDEKHVIDLNYDFQLADTKPIYEHSCLHKWYGLKRYVVLSPTNNAGICNESKIKVLQSSLYVAANNLNYAIPMFVKIREKWQQLYLGVYENKELRTNFEMIHLRKGPQHSEHLTGLLSLFKSKLMSPVLLDGITSSVQFRYDLTDFGKGYVSHSKNTSENDTTFLYTLPLGVKRDPVNTLQLKCTWFNLPDYMISDSTHYTDFEPMKAHQMSLLIKPAEQANCLLEDCLTEFLQLNENNSTINEIIGEFNPIVLLESKVADIPSLLTRTARNSLSNIGNRDSKPIKDSIFVPLLYFLFPDAEEVQSHPYDIKNNENSPIKNKLQESGKITSENVYHGLKTCPIDSLLWRFSIVSAHALKSLGGIRGFAYIWYEFCQEMRYRWEKNILIPGLIREFPDLRTGLLNQKLQMLNCCIERKLEREDSQKEASYDSAEGSSSDDEFFDCADKLEEETKKKLQPVGRLTKYQNLKLLETGDDLFIPYTQDPGPKTEDQLQEDADFLMKLGADAIGSELRAKIMSASLLSDMESFKAANPGAILEDFVRWYSPRDWEEEEEEGQWGQKKGRLSHRMLIEDNIWAQKWKSAKPVPANKQKLLFVDTREAEKVLHFLETRTLSQIFQLLIPILLHAAIYQLQQDIQALELIECATKLERIVESTKRLTRDSKINVRRVESIVQEMSLLELDISKVKFLRCKLSDRNDDAIRDLAVGKEVKIERETEIAERVLALFAEVQRNASMISEGETERRDNSVFALPNEREFVMRTLAVRPARYSARSPQCLRALLSNSEFRLIGAFTEDICFF